jgi:UDP-glucose 4-epimerase
MTEKPFIIITGGAGYIGSHTLIELTFAGYEVISIDNFSNASPLRIQLVAEITGKTIKNYPIDLCDYSEVRRVFTKYPQAVGVIHFAAYMSVEESVQNPLKYYDNNLNSLRNVLAISEEMGIKNIVYSSSCSVYGNPEISPVSEQTPLQSATSPYAETKLVGEKMIADFAKVSHANFIILRYFNPVGAHLSGKNGEFPSRKPYNLLPVIVEVAAGIRASFTIYGQDYPTKDGTCVRDYIHVSDIARAHISALVYIMAHKNTEQVEVFNLGTGKGVSVQEIVNAFESVNHIQLNYQIGERRAGDVVAVYADNSRAAALLGWSPQVNLEEMMQSAWKWQQFLMANE